MSTERRPDMLVLDREYDGTTGTLRAVRDEVLKFMQAHVSDEDLHERAELVVSELATNAIQAAPGVAYRLRVSLLEAGSIELAVTSFTDRAAPPPRERWGPVHARAPRGRGLLIVDELTDRVEVERPSDNTIVVTATLHAAPVH